ncbi:hypothetical protein SISNIDRAFT_457099 [Sistotremastrum niveocremeum HHB9708]|uniref:GYF domain-containing protein n=1 Tax=Sistotremastrum niveocremeum HHB9708 TaxID=1314777 RepID=A0A164S2Z8_9AGAM|nr:hypothetical protein SISNIDRAFT_457099 [Sistotremastrum niveocremeum HHB9708]
MPPRSTQKRSAAALDSGPSEPSRPSGSVPTQKKTRFVSPSDDPEKFIEQVDDALEDRAPRRGAVKTEGYDSDSSDDGEGVVYSRRKDKQNKDDEDDDMFAVPKDGEDEEDGEGKKKKEVEMRLGDIEGQEFGQTTNEGFDSDDDDEPVDEDEAERRSKIGMGYELSAFNMREEMDEGKVLNDGEVYVKSYDPHAAHDRWMEGVDERDMKKARRSMKKREREEKERLEREAANALDTTELEKELVGLLRKAESVLEALARLGARAKKEKAAAKKSGKTVSQSTQHQIDRLTTIASALLPENVDIYSATYESILRSLRSSGKVPPEWTPPSQNIKLEYRWADPTQGQENETFGPFSEEELRAWYGAAYFGQDGERILLRRVGEEYWGTWEETLG